MYSASSELPTPYFHLVPKPASSRGQHAASRPADAQGGRLRSRDDRLYVVADQPAAPLHDVTVDHHGVHVCGRRRLHDSRLDVGDRGDVDVVAANQDDVGPLTDRERAGHVTEPERARC